ncbi:MAG: Cholesterol oxidase, partial [Myxococcaceae bacterium]|nr:Cholesterol oxidase [Myxococcaceae bacterium]
GNGDYLAIAFQTSHAFQTSDGPTITTAIVIDQGNGDQRDWFIFEEGGYPKEIAGLLKVLSPVLEGFSLPRRLHREVIEEQIRELLDKASVASTAAAPASDGAAIFLAMGRDRANGKLELLPGFGLHVQWDNRLNLPLYAAEEQMARDVAHAMEGVVGTNPLWTTLHIPVSVHNLGGCAMGADPTEGVTDAHGEVFGYPGLYVFDGAILPDATGVNPSHTIAAVTERNIERVIRSVLRDPTWQAPERAMAPTIVDPLANIVIPPGGTAPFRTPSIGLSFTETMKGFLAFQSWPSGAADPTIADYVAAERAGQRAERNAQFTLDITFPNLDAFLADPAHGGVAEGTLYIPGLTPPQGAKITSGAFNLFSMADEFYERQMLYGLPFVGADRKPYFLEGYKEVKDHGNFDVWSSTTTLYTRVRQGQSKDGPVVALGVLHIHALDFLHQMTTFRVSGTHNPVKQAEAIARFGQVFMGSLWDVFVRRGLQ